MSSNRVAGRGRRCTEAIDPRNRLPRLTRPTKRREGRECVTHGCGAVRMCTCHGLESRGAYRYTPYHVTAKKIPSRSYYSVFLGPWFTPGWPGPRPQPRN
jgi:hypothetical protein